MGVGRFLREQVPGIADRRRRAALRRAGLRAAQPRRGLRPRAVRRVGADHPVLGRPARRRPPHPRAARAGGHLRRHLHRRDPARRAGRGRARRSRRASGPTSRSSSATAAGSTSRPAPTTAPSTRPRTRSTASSGPDRPQWILTVLTVTSYARCGGDCPQIRAPALSPQRDWLRRSVDAPQLARRTSSRAAVRRARGRSGLRRRARRSCSGSGVRITRSPRRRSRNAGRYRSRRGRRVQWPDRQTRLGGG